VDIELRVHLERVDDADTRWVWWADSQQLPGFSAAADHLPDLMSKAKAVILEEGMATEDAKITTVLIPVERSSEGPALNVASAVQSLGPAGPLPRQAVSTRTLVTT
jgi:hypothetical protein